MIAELKKNPDKYTYGNDGLGGPGQLATARILRAMNASSLRDLGLPNEETILWRAVLVPKGTPPERVAKLEAAFEKAANAAAAKKFLEDAGEQVASKKGAELRRYIDNEYEAMGKLAKALNLTPQ